jgi:hypothetical protein
VQMRVACIELLQLAERTPAVVTVPRLVQIRMTDHLEATREVETRGRLMGQALVLDEAVLSG